MSVRRYTGLAAALGVAITLAGCASSNSNGSGGDSSASGGSYTFYLSNNFIGNDWRQQMTKTASLATKLAPFAGP